MPGISENSAGRPKNQREHTRQAQQGIQSVEIAGSILRAIVEADGPLNLKALAEDTQIPAPKLHRYLLSLIRIGLVQKSDTKLYELGSYVLTLGAAGFRRLDVVRIAMPLMTELRDALNHSVFLSIWTDHGATIVSWLDSARPVVVNTRAGWSLPLLHSATGRMFAAFLPMPRVAGHLEHEWNSDPRAPDRESFNNLLTEIRNLRLSRVQGDVLPNVHAFAAPIWNHEGDLAAVLTMLGSPPSFDSSWGSREANALMQQADALSAALGFRSRGPTRRERRKPSQ